MTAKFSPLVRGPPRDSLHVGSEVRRGLQGGGQHRGAGHGGHEVSLLGPLPPLHRGRHLQVASDNLVARLSVVKTQQNSARVKTQ